jgi:hypothetical protein
MYAQLRRIRNVGQRVEIDEDVPAVLSYAKVGHKPFWAEVAILPQTSLHA